MFCELKEINKKPGVYEFYTAPELWTNQHTAEKMLEYHLNESVDAASRNRAFIDKSAGWITEKFELNSRSRVIDFGCGPGLYTLRLARSGAAVTGVDFSQNSLSYAEKEARREGVAIKYINENYLNFETEDRFDLITMIMCDFTALSPSQRKGLLGKFSTLLKPEGAVLLDVYSLEYFRKKTETAVYEFNQMDNFWDSNDYYGFLNIFKYENEKVLLDKYTIYLSTEKREIYNWAQCYSEGSLSQEFEENGFIIEGFYGDVAGKAYDPERDEFAVVARKQV